MNYEKSNTLLLFIVFSLAIVSCKSFGQRDDLKFVTLKDSIKKNNINYILEEFKVTCNDKNLENIINDEIYSLSVNSIKSKKNSLRLKEKKKLLQECLNDSSLGCENYSPERIVIISKTPNFLSLKYIYNSLNDKDEYFKYATFNLKTGKRITYDMLFSDVEKVIQLYENKYLLNFDVNDEEIKGYLEDRERFTSSDLNNFDFEYDTKGNIKAINFYYNGMGGNYRSIFPSGFEKIEIEKIFPLLTTEFKETINAVKKTAK